MGSWFRITEDVLDVNTALWPVLMGQGVSIAKNKKKKSTTVKIYLPIGVFGAPGHSLLEPTGW
jgi:hypothetical protein